MALTKCARCKKIYVKIASPVCQQCQPDEDADFSKIHNAIRKQSGLNAEAIAENAGVELECVLRMLNAGRLRVKDLGEKPTCGRCGAPAISMAKRLCESCLVELDRECADAMRELQKEIPRGVRGRKGAQAGGVLGEVRAEIEGARKSDAQKRAAELEERAHPARSTTVAREAREKKDRR